MYTATINPINRNGGGLCAQPYPAKVFSRPTGSDVGIGSPGQTRTNVQQLQAAGIKVLLTLMGSRTDSGGTAWPTALTSRSGIQTNVIDRYGLDGIDIDDEFIGPSNTQNFMNTIRVLAGHPAVHLSPRNSLRRCSPTATTISCSAMIAGFPWEWQPTDAKRPSHSFSRRSLFS